MASFHALRVQEVARETADSVVVSFDIPDALKEAFAFQAGQYLTLKTAIGGEEVRRSYSLCSAPSDGAWKVGIKKVPGGKFSTYANEELQAGTSMEVMDPQGRFVLKEGRGLHHVGIAAGSGITPILSQVKELLSTDERPPTRCFTATKSPAPC